MSLAKLKNTRLTYKSRPYFYILPTINRKWKLENTIYYGIKNHLNLGILKACSRLIDRKFLKAREKLKLT